MPLQLFYRLCLFTELHAFFPVVTLDHTIVTGTANGMIYKFLRIPFAQAL